MHNQQKFQVDTIKTGRMRIFLKKTLCLAQLINGHLLKKIELSEGEQWPVNGMLPGPFLLRFMVVKGLKSENWHRRVQHGRLAAILVMLETMWAL